MPNVGILELIPLILMFALIGLLIAVVVKLIRSVLRYLKARTLVAEQQARLARLQADQLEAERPHA